MKRMMMGCLGMVKMVSLTNLVSNGSMDSTTGWRTTSSLSTQTIVSGELKSTKNSGRPYVGNTSAWGIATGHKLYISMNAYGNKSGTLKTLAYGTFGTNDAGYFDTSLTTSPQRVSYILTTASVVANGITFDGVSFTSTGDYILLDNAIVIDLTAAWGAGSEPTLSQMDTLMGQFTNSWFDGTQNAVYNW